MRRESGKWVIKKGTAEFSSNLTVMWIFDVGTLQEGQESLLFSWSVKFLFDIWKNTIS